MTLDSEDISVHKRNLLSQTIISMCVIIILAIQLTDGFRYGPNAVGGNNRMDADDWDFDSNGDPSQKADALSELGESSNFITLSKNVSANILEKRHDHSSRHSCSCDTKADRTFLGEGVYPRYYASIVCDWDKIARREPICRSGSQCKETYHKVLALKVKNELTPPQENTHDLPRKIRNDYYFETHVSVDLYPTSFIDT